MSWRPGEQHRAVRRLKVWKAVIRGAVVGSSLVSCAHSGAPAESPSPDVVSGQVTVFAAASLRVVFPELEKLFEAKHPGTTVRFDFAGSPDLVAQLEQGAPGEVFASADEANMRRAQQEGLVLEPKIFATNHLVIVTAPGNPKQIGRLADLGEPGLSVVVCAQQVPCGALAHAVEAKAGVAFAPKSQEPSVTDVLTKITSGEADAGLVYTTDARSAGDKVAVVQIPEGDALATKYPIAVVKDAHDHGRGAVAQAFVDLVLSPQGQAVLGQAGFGKP